MTKSLILLIALCVVFTAGASSDLLFPEKKKEDQNQKSANEIIIASYNVHNLFDTKKDEGKNDWSFLAKDFPGKIEYCKTLTNKYYKQTCLDTNWNSKRLKRKFIAIKKMITKGFSEMPDIIALQEVENDNVVAELAEFIGYDLSYTTNSADRRGIDVAIMVKKNKSFQILNAIEHDVKGEFLVKPTRNVIELVIAIGDEKLSVFSNHWPSQAAPSEVRVGVAKLVKEIVNERLQDPKHHVILTGDFNVINKDHPHPFKDVLEVGDNPMINVHQKFKRSRKVSRDIKDAQPLGTYFYKRNMEWNVLDNFFASKNLRDGSGMEIDIESFRIVAPRFSKKDFLYDRNRKSSLYGAFIPGIPKAYNTKVSLKILDAGYSDHFPVVVKVKF